MELSASGDEYMHLSNRQNALKTSMRATFIMLQLLLGATYTVYLLVQKNSTFQPSKLKPATSLPHPIQTSYLCSIHWGEDYYVSKDESNCHGSLQSWPFYWPLMIKDTTLMACAYIIAKTMFRDVMYSTRHEELTYSFKTRRTQKGWPVGLLKAKIKASLLSGTHRPLFSSLKRLLWDMTTGLYTKFNCITTYRAMTLFWCTFVYLKNKTLILGAL